MGGRVKLGADMAEKEARRTRTEGVVGPLKLLARSVVLALGGDALEVIRVVLEAARGQGACCMSTERGGRVRRRQNTARDGR